MQTLRVTIDNIANARLIYSILNKLSFVKSVETEYPQTEESFEPLSKEDWIKPGRLATDEEFEYMIAEMEEEERAGLGMVAEKAEEYATKRIEEWQKKSK